MFAKIYDTKSEENFMVKPDTPFETKAGSFMFMNGQLVFSMAMNGLVTIHDQPSDDRFAVLHNDQLLDVMLGYVELAQWDNLVIRNSANNQSLFVVMEIDYSDEPTVEDPTEIDDEDEEATNGDLLLDEPEEELALPAGTEIGTALTEHEGLAHDQPAEGATPKSFDAVIVCTYGKRSKMFTTKLPSDTGEYFQLPWPFDNYEVDAMNQGAEVAFWYSGKSRSSTAMKVWETRGVGWRVYPFSVDTWLTEDRMIKVPEGTITLLRPRVTEPDTIKKYQRQKRWHALKGDVSQNWFPYALIILLLFLTTLVVGLRFDERRNAVTQANTGITLYNIGATFEDWGQSLKANGERRYNDGLQRYEAIIGEEQPQDEPLPPTVTPMPATATPTPQPTETATPFGMYEEYLPKEVMAGGKVTITGYFPAGTEFSLFDDSDYLWGSTEVDVVIQTVTFNIPETMQGEITIVATHGNRQDELTVQVISPFGCPIFTDPGPGRFTLNYWVNVPYGDNGIPLTPQDGYLFQCHMRETPPYIVYFNEEAGTISFDSRQRLAPTGSVHNFVVELSFEMDVTPEGDYPFVIEHDDGVQIEIINAETTAPVYFYRNWQIGSTHHNGTLGIHEGTERVLVSIKIFEWDNRGLSRLVFRCPTCWEQPEAETITAAPSTAVAQPTVVTPAAYQPGPFDQIEITNVQLNNRGSYYEVVVDTNDPLTDRWNTYVHTWADGCSEGGDRIDGTATTYRQSNFYPSSEAWGSCTFHVELRNGNSTHTYDTYEVVYHFDRVEAVNGPPPAP